MDYCDNIEKFLNSAPKEFEQFSQYILKIIEGYSNEKCIDRDIDWIILLKHAFLINISWDDDPIKVHAISKNILNYISNPKKSIQFAKYISNFSRFSLNVSLCLVWLVFQIETKQMEDVGSFHLYKFSTLYEGLQAIDINDLIRNTSKSLLLIDIVSYFISVIIIRNVAQEVGENFRKYYIFCTKDVENLKDWAYNTMTYADQSVRSTGSFCINNFTFSEYLHSGVIRLLESIS